MESSSVDQADSLEKALAILILFGRWSETRGAEDEIAAIARATVASSIGNTFGARRSRSHENIEILTVGTSTTRKLRR